MSVLVQITNGYILDPATKSVKHIECPDDMPEKYPNARISNLQLATTVWISMAC